MSNCQIAHAAEIEPDYYARFQSLTVDMGLPDSYVTVIKQDNRGFIWIGTRNGLARYDGVSFHIYLHSEDSCSISDNYITDIVIAPDQQLWVATRNGLNRYLRKKECFERIPNMATSGKGISHPYIRAILPDNDDVLWVETLDGNLHKMNGSTFDSKIFPHQRIIQEYYDYHSIYLDSKGLIWVGGRNLGPIYLAPGSQKFTTIENDPLDASKKRDKDVAFYFEDSEQQFWIGATDGVYIYDRETTIFTKMLATSTFDMIEDESQNLWMATGGGIYRYNMSKKQFTRYVNSESDPFSVVDNHITCIFKDHNGNIWAGTKSGISIWFNSQNSVRQYRHLHQLPRSLSDDDVNCFLEDDNSVLWIGTKDGGLNRYNEESDDFNNWNTQKGGLLSNNISTMYQDAQKDIWIGYWQGLGFQKMSLFTHMFSSYALRPDSRKADWYNAFIDYNDSTLMTGIWGASGLHLFDKNTETFLTKNWKAAYHPVSNPIYHLSKNGDALWMDSKWNLIYNFGINNKTFNAYRSEQYGRFNSIMKVESAKIPPFTKINAIYTVEEKTYFLTDRGVLLRSKLDSGFKILTKIAFDAVIHIAGDDKLWLGNKDGLSYFDANMQLLHAEKSSNSYLNGQVITALSYLDSQRLIVGTNDGVFIYNTQKQSFEEGDSVFFNHNTRDLHTTKIVKLSEDKFIFTHQQGFTYYKASHQELTYYDLKSAFSKGLSSDFIYDAILNSYGTGIWLATDQGIFHFDDQNIQFRKLDILSNTPVYNIVTVDSFMYLATHTGLLAFDMINEKLVAYNEPPDDILTSHLTSFIQRDQKGFIWSGTTNQGVNRMDPLNDKIAHFYSNHGFSGKSALAFCETRHGIIFIGGDSLNIFDPRKQKFYSPNFANQLPDEEILSIIEDDNDWLYITTAHHIFRINRNQNILQELNNILNVKNITFTRGALRRSNGEILIGSNKGYFTFQSDQINILQPLSKVQVTSMNVIGHKVNTEIAFEDLIVLPYDHNFFTVEFSGMDFSSAETEYQYQLKGVDKSWVSTTSSSVAYTKISHGNYTFRVKRMGERERNVFQFNIQINPPFWATWWFRIVILFSMLLLVSFWWYQRLLKVRMAEKNLELKQRLLLSQMNPHFLFNTLTAIQGFIYKSEPVVAGSYLSKFARLMRLYLNSMSYDIVSLQKEIDALRFYLELQEIRFDHNFNFTIDVDCDEDYSMVGFPSMMIQPFVENAVEHGMKTITQNGNIRCSLQLKKQLWVITIQDNGPGIILEQIKSKKGHPSMSTKISRDRLATLSKQFKTEFTLSISNLSKSSATESGTKVEMTLPVLDVNEEH